MTQTIGTTDQPDNDLYLNSTGIIAILQGIDAVVSACQTAARLALGEAVLATTTGIPYFQAVFNGSPNQSVFESYLRTAWQNVNGVNGVQSLTISIAQATLSYTATIQSIYGPAEISGTVPL